MKKAIKFKKMDINRALKILVLLEADEADLSISEKIQNIYNLLSQNNNETNQSAGKEFSLLLKDIQSSRAYLFSGIENKILKQLQVESLFGQGLLGQLTKIRNKPGFEVTSELSEFRSKRSDQYNRLMQLKTILVDIGIKPYAQGGDEIAFSLPEELSTIDNTAEYLKKFGLFIKSIQDISAPKGKREEIKITGLNKGSNEFFVLAEPETLSSLLDILSNIATVYLAVKEIKKSKSINGGLTEEENKRVAELYEQIAQKRIESFLENKPKEIAPNATHEQAQNLRTYLKMLLKWLPLGIEVEIVLEKSAAKGSLEKSKINSVKKIEELRNISEMYRLPKESLLLPLAHGSGDASASTPSKKGSRRKTTTTKKTTKKKKP
jgi:hypothetical protein